MNTLLKDSFEFQVGHILKIVLKLSVGLCLMHKNKIIHRDINLDNLAIKLRSKQCLSSSPVRKSTRSRFTYLKIRLINFDFAFNFKKVDHEVIQTFNVTDRPIAPEMVANERHGYPTDVWGLGQIISEFLEVYA